MLKSAALREHANHELAAAKAVAEKVQAEGRDLSGEEMSTYRKHFDAAKALAEQCKTAVADEQVLAEAKSLADELGLGGDAVADLQAQGETPAPARQQKSLGARVVESAQYKSMLGQFRGSDEFGNVRIPEKARVESSPIHFKALLTGASPTSGGVFLTPEQTGIVEMLGRRPLSIRDLVSVRRTGADAVEYVAQTAHTNNAAPVPEATSAAFPEAGVVAGGFKPESGWAFARRSATVITLAHWVPATKRALADVAQLEGLINDELVADLAQVEEAQLLAGSGTGENLTGILNTSGIQTLAAADADVFTAVRRALTAARITGRVVPSAIVMNPVQVEGVDLSRADGTTGAFLAGGPFGATQRTMWGVPVVESESIAAGTALLGDFSKAVLWDRQQATVTVTDSHADFFVRNLVAILAEQRVAFAVTRPSAFVVVTGL